MRQRKKIQELLRSDSLVVDLALEFVRRAGQHPGMNKQRSTQFLVAGIFGALMTSCAMFHHANERPVVGTWTNAVGTVWTIKADGTFDVDLTKDGKRDAWGTYTLAGETITLHGTGGFYPKGCRGKGVYRFKRDDDNLQFTFVSDSCKLRKKNVLLGWRKK